MSEQSTEFTRILLVEDDPSHALIIKRALRGIFPGEISHALTMAEAEQMAADPGIDLIISDLNIPGAAPGEPLNLAQRVAPGVPVVVLTSSTSIHDAVTAMKQGARDFVVKDFDADFKAVLSLALSRVGQSIAAERMRLKLQRENETLRVSIENNQDGLALIDSTGAVGYANRAFLAFARRCGTESKMLLEIFSDEVILKADKLKEALARNLQSLADGGVFSTEVGFKAEKTMAFELSLSGLPGPARTFAVWVRDRSAQKQREQFQREILSTTTHDLKGPLGAILISADLLTNMTKDMGKAKELAIRIGSSAQGAINLIDEFLSARRIQEGTFILKPTAQELQVLLQEAAEDFTTIAAARSVKLEVHAGSAKVEAQIDRLGFIRVVSNLLSNAIKFTPKGGTVSLTLFERGGDVHVTVKDTGCGMEPSEVNSLFERFTRLEKHRDVAGTGLGLFVVRSIVTAHGGRIDVTSRVGEGTSFDLTFPKQPPVNERGELISLNFA